MIVSMPSPRETFFGPGEEACEEYKQLRDSEPGTWLRRDADFAESMWPAFRRYADRNFLSEARRPEGFWARYWEMYLFSTFVDLGWSPTSADEGPDVRAATPNGVVWLEAITPRLGDGLDAIPKPVLNEAHDAPVSQLILRYRATIREKERKLREYFDKKIVQHHDATVIAINTSMIAGACPERALPTSMSVPAFIRAVFPIGRFAIQLDDTGATVSSRFQYSPKVDKANGKPVETTIFMDQSHAHISALLISRVCPRSYPEIHGGDHIVVHNPNAHVPLPRPWLKRGAEYWVEDGKLEWKDYGIAW